MKKNRLLHLLLFTIAFSYTVHSQVESPTTLQALHATNPAAPKDFTGAITRTDGNVAHNGSPSAANQAVSGENIHSLITYAGNTATQPLVLAHVVGWFCPTKTSATDYACDGHAILTTDPAYDDNNLSHIQAQIDEMLRRGIDGVTVLWKGTKDANNKPHFLDKTVQLYLQAADQLCTPGGCPFRVGVMDSQGADYSGCGSTTTPTCTDVYVTHLNYIYNNYVVGHSSALRASDGRPILSNFDLQSNYSSINFATAFSRVSFNPYLVFNWKGGATPSGSYAGYFQWVHPRYNPPANLTDKNRANDPNIDKTINGNISLDYFYSSFPGALNFGSAYPGFDDSAASWGNLTNPRKMNRKCGRTWLDTMAEVNNNFFSSAKPLEFIQLPTWDDYEEGSELETGISNCLTSVTGSTTGDTLNLGLAFGSEPYDWNRAPEDGGAHHNTIRRYDVYYATQDPASATSDSQVDLIYAGSENDTDAGVTSINLANGNFNFPPGQLWLFVNVVGKPLIQNHVNSKANAISYLKAGGVAWNPTTYNFGNEVVGQRSPVHQFALTNGTGSTLTNLAIATSGPFVKSATATAPCGTSLASNASCNANVSFSPTATGAMAGSLTATFTGGNATSSLQGTGQPASPDSSWTASGNADPAVSDTVIQLDGSSTRFNYTGGAPYTDGQWATTPSGDFSTSSQFTLDFWARMDTPGSSQAFEVRTQQIVGGREYPFKLECDFKDSQAWLLWNPSTSGWTTTTVPCAPLTPNSWNHFTVKFERTSGNQLHYQDVTINGTTYTFDKFVGSIPNSAAAGVNIRVRLVGDSVPHPYAAWIDKLVLSGQSTRGALDIDDRNWTCSNNCSAAVADTTIQHDGSSKRFPYTGGAAFSSGQWVSTLTENFSSATNFTLDFWGYMADPGSSQAFEVKADQVVGGREFPFALQCAFKDGQVWKVWDQAGQTWVATTAPCSALPANTWVHFVMHFDRTPTNSLHYQDVVVNATTSALNKTVGSVANSGADSTFVRFKLIGATGTAYSFRIDEMSLTY